MDLRDRLSIEYPVLQAGMGGGIAGAELATAVTLAGGLGCVGFNAPPLYEAAIRQTRAAVADRPFAANLLMPFMRRAHLQILVQQQVPVVTLFYGQDPRVIRTLKAAGSTVICQIGSGTEAQRAIRSGADGLIVQGVQGGGHVRGTERLESLLPEVRARHPEVPVIAAGGIWDRHSAWQALSMGADGISCGTRFLMSRESLAHASYKQRLLDAQETRLTTLFGLGWPSAQRVLINAAVRRWCDDQGQPHAGIRALNFVSQFGARHVPLGILHAVLRAQRVGRPFFSPLPAVVGMDDLHMDAVCDYAGECVREIRSLEAAASAVGELAAGC